MQLEFNRFNLSAIGLEKISISVPGLIVMLLTGGSILDGKSHRGGVFLLHPRGRYPASIRYEHYFSYFGKM